MFCFILGKGHFNLGKVEKIVPVPAANSTKGCINRLVKTNCTVKFWCT